MTELESMNQRLTEMEAHLAHQDVTLQHLSDNAAKQWATIDRNADTACVSAAWIVVVGGCDVDGLVVCTGAGRTASGAHRHP